MSLEPPRKEYTRCTVWVLRLCIIFLITSFSSLSATGPTTSTETAEFFDYFEKYFPSIRTTIKDIDSAPESSLWPFTRDKDSYDTELNDYLDEAISLLLPKDLINFRTEFKRIDSDLELLREAKSNLEADRALGRASRADASRFEKTIRSVLGSDVSRLVFGDDVEAQIRELEAHREELVHTFRDRLETDLGTSLDLKQCESLLYQANGDDLLGAIATARSLTEVEGHVRTVLVKSNDDFSAKVRVKYYGLALIVRLTIERLTEKHLRNYDEKYLPALAELADDNSRIRRENIRLLDELIDRRHDRLKIEHNIRSLDNARTAIDNYRGLLKRKREEVNRMLKDAASDAKVARSTLRTLEHVMSVVNIASRALEEFNSLSQLNTHDLLPLDDENLYNDYLDISRSLAVKLGG